MLQLFLRILLGLIFVISSWGKIRYPRVFAESLSAYQVLPDNLITLVALTLPWLELLAGLLLLVGYRVRGGALVIGAMSALFFLVVSSVIWRGLDLSCGCFVGVEWARVNWRHLVLNLVLLGSAAVVYRRGPGPSLKAWWLGRKSGLNVA